MSAARVLSAAAALREFDLDQIAAFCDEPREVILTVLDDAAGCVQPAGDGPRRWRVVDHQELRRRSREFAAAEQDPDRPMADPTRGQVPDRILDQRPDQLPDHGPDRRFRPGADLVDARLRYAEEMLLGWDDQRPYEEQRLALMAASNALQQAAASVSAKPRAWWQLEITPGTLDPGPAVDIATLTRLQVTEAVVYLTRQGLVRRHPDTEGLVVSTKRLLGRAQDVDLGSMSDLVKRFVDLVLTLAAPTTGWAAPDRLVAAVAKRRVRADLRRSLVAGLDHLIPVVEGVVGRDPESAPGLFSKLDDLPAGRMRVVVYTELLELLPRRFGYRQQGSCLLGTLIEAVTEPDTADQLRRCASWLTDDLTRSPYGSDNALIGSAVHTLQQIAEYGASDDTSVIERSESRCRDLLQLAKVSVG